VRGESFNGVELALELFVRNRRVDVRVAGTAEQGNPVFDVRSVEIALVAAIPVPGLGNQMMASQLADLPRTQLAFSAATNSTAVFHGNHYAQAAAQGMSRSVGERRSWPGHRCPLRACPGVLNKRSDLLLVDQGTVPQQQGLQAFETLGEALILFLQPP